MRRQKRRYTCDGCGRLAQVGERLPYKEEGAGSSPAPPTILRMGGMAMAKYLGVYATACLTRRQLQELVTKLMEPGEVRCEKAYAGIVSGVLVCLFTAPSREALEEFQKRHGMVPEHLWRIDLESQEGQLVSV